MTSLYNQVVPPFIASFENASAILDKAAEFAKEKGIAESDVVNWTLHEDMRPLSFQVNVMALQTRWAAQHFTVIADKDLGGEAKSIADLQKIISGAIDFLKSIDANHPDAPALDKEYIENYPGGPYKFTSESYIRTWSIPNFYFHATTLYDICRAKGVVLGKKDFLGKTIIKA